MEVARTESKAVTAELVRNFCIIAHIDHGKTTLSDRLLEITKTILARDAEEQHLDTMDLERERGITIKAHPVTLSYPAADGQIYSLNLIDTPGHVDFSSEVSRSLAACEGALLVVDASQGVEAQTLANYHLALEHDLTIIPVINKIDLPVRRPGPDPDRDRRPARDRPRRCDPRKREGGHRNHRDPRGDRQAHPAAARRQLAPARPRLRRAVRSIPRGRRRTCAIVDGSLAPGTRFMSMAHRRTYECTEVGVFKPDMRKTESLELGTVGYVIANIRSLGDIDVGDTITVSANPAPTPLRGYRPAVPMVYCGLYPNEGVEYAQLRDALEKLKLNDAALVYEPESSVALGFGFRCGFLGLLHMEIVQERLERNYNIDLIATSPSVEFRATLTDGTVLLIDNPSQLPEATLHRAGRGAVRKATILTPQEYVGAIMEIAQARRGTLDAMEYLHDGRVLVRYEMPLIEVIVDFFDQLKSRTKGYASLDYELIGYRPGDLVKLEILLNAEPVDALSFIVARDKATQRGRALTERLKELIPRQMFDVPIQAAIGRQDHRARNGQRDAQERAGEMLRRRHHPQAQAAGEAEGRQGAHEARRPGRPAAGGLHGRPAARGIASAIPY